MILFNKKFEKFRLALNKSFNRIKLSVGQTSNYKVKDRRAKTKNFRALAKSSECNHSTRNSTQVRTGNSNGRGAAENAVGSIEQSVTCANTV